MDEFEELEEEFFESNTSSNSELNNLVNLLNFGEVNPDHIIFHEDILYTPKKKIAYLLGGLFLIGTIIGLGLGVYIIWYIFKLGPLWSSTNTVISRYYLGFNHSVIVYECKDEQLIDVKLIKLDDDSYVFIESVSSGDHGSRDVFSLFADGEIHSELWSVPGIKRNIRNVEEFCRISGVNLELSNPMRKKYQKILKDN